MGFVYKITCIPSAKSYIGISIHEPEKRRIRAHLSGKGNRYIANAVKKYGKDAFTYEILEENVFPQLLPDLEIAYIKKFNTVKPNGFNLTYGGEQNKKPSDETRRKMSEAQKGKKRSPHSAETRRKISESHKGKPRSKEHSENISRALKGKPSWHKGKKRSKETCEKIGRASKGRVPANKGKPRTEQERENISSAVKRALKGKPAWNKGKPLSQEHCKKISKSKLSNPLPEESRERIGRKYRGKSLPKETREKMSQSSTSIHKQPAHKLFFDLPEEMPLAEKRKVLFDNFLGLVSRNTVYNWIRQWSKSTNQGSQV